jgi:HK97 family phage portal protein
MQKRTPFRQRLANVISGNSKSLIPSLNPVDGVNLPGGSSGGRINTFASKQDQIAALTGWVFAANSAIAEPCAAVEFKLYRKQKDGDRQEVTSGKDLEILELLSEPNMVHTGEQMRQLHFTYMNVVGESYIFMRDLSGEAFIPSKGRLPAALDIFPAHLVQFRLGTTYTQSTVHIGTAEYPVTSFIRDLNPDPMNPYNGRSIIAASARTIDLEEQMKTWNQGLFANGARPSLIFSTDQPLDDDAYERWKKQFSDEHTGADAAYKPLLIEGGKATPWMMNQQDLDFLASRKFSRDEILAMFKVSPGMIGSVENVNRSNLEAGFYINAVVNVVPRVRQFVRQINATFVKVYDPTLEVDFVNPVPEDVEAKLKAAEAGVDKWWTKDEVRDMYGEKPLPDGLGEHIIVQGKGAMSLEDVLANDPVKPADTTQVATDESKSLEGKQSVKKP